MTIPPWLIEVWLWSYVVTAFVLVSLALFAAGKCLVHLKSKRLDDALHTAGLSVAFLATSLAIALVPARAADNALATHRYNCVMYELALQRNADPDLPDVDIDPAWHELECYSAP